MVVFPNAKINIGLQVMGKRPDGYHNLQTVFYPVAIKDALELIESPTATKDSILFSSSGNIIDGKEQDNLCIKAIQLLKKDFPNIPPLQIHLHKNIPTGAGLGGGSADGAFMLQLLNNIFNLELSQELLGSYALELGSDAPFFIINRPCYASSRGEVLEGIHIDLSAYRMLIVNPGIHINTAEAFQSLQPRSIHTDLKLAIQRPVEEWKNIILNDFETSVFKINPAIKMLKEQLYSWGALFASMSGSGSSVYGLFKKELQPAINFPAGYFHKWL